MNKIPFPQANNIELIYKIMFDIGPSGISRFAVAKKYNLSERQGAYYLDALYYIGVVEKRQGKYFLNRNGINLRLMPYDDIEKAFCESILQDDLIGKLFVAYKNCGSTNNIITVLGKKIAFDTGLMISTSERRASTMVNWFDWIEERI